MNSKIESKIIRNKSSNHTKIRVLFVSHDGGMAGAQKTLLTLLATIDRDCFEPFLLLPCDGGTLHLEAEKLDIPVIIQHLVHWVPCISFATKKQRFLLFVKVFEKLRARSRAIADQILLHKIDVVYTNTVTCIEGAIAAKTTQTPHIWHIHETIIGNSELSPILPFKFYVLTIKLLSKSVIFCSAILEKSYLSLHAKATVVHNGLPCPAVLNREGARNAILQHYKINPRCKLVAVVGVLHPRKDHFTFLEAAHKVILKNKDVFFLIVGTGRKNHTDFIRDTIDSLGITSSVVLTGWSNEIHHLLAGLDVLVVSSEQESFGLTIIEALAMETPVVATRCGGPEEIIINGQTGLLVPVRDPESMAEAIMKILQNPQLARIMGQQGRKDVLKRFSVNQYTEGVEKIIEQSVSDRKKN